MATQRIEHTVQGYTYKRPKRTPDDVDFSLGPEQSKNRQDKSADLPKDSVRRHIQSLLAEVAGGEGKLSFSDVSAHHEWAQKYWHREVTSELAQLGVDVNSPFRLMYDPAGVVTVAGDHSDKEMIESYFIANPDKGRELGEILQYGKLDTASKNRLAPAEMKQNLTTEAMAWWYTSNMDTGLLLSGGGMVFGSGGTVYKGLDIRV